MRFLPQPRRLLAVTLLCGGACLCSPRLARADEPPAVTAEAGAAVAQGEKADRERDKEKDKAKKTAVAIVELDGSMTDGVGQGGLLADMSPHLHRIVERLDKAATDPRVKGVLLAIGSPDLGRARADELRAAVARVRKAGKPVTAHLVGSAPGPYAVALACDRIVMPPAATLEITGVRAEVMFYKTLLDRLSVDAEILQVGEFKGAGEPMTRSAMSPQLRAQYESFVGDLFEQLVERVAAERKLAPEKVRELIDVGVFTPQAALAAGLIDAVGYQDEAVAELSRTAGIDEPRVVREYGAKKVDTDFSGVGGMVKLLEMLSGKKPDAPAGKDRQVAVVYLTGEITQGKGTDDILAGGSAGGETICKAIREAAANPKVVAIVLRIDSPGGSALASDLIWREAVRCTKPVVASLSDTAASGGYYVAVGCDKIVAAPGTLTGSIGVVGGKISVGNTLEKVGVHTDVVSRGRNAGWLSMQTPFTPPEREAFLDTMNDVYRLFTSKVAEGRKLDPDRVGALAEGRVYTGRMAKGLGLVDRLGTLDDAVDEAKQLAGIAGDAPVERLLLPEPRGLFEDLFGATAIDGAPAVKAAAALPVPGAALRGLLLARIAGIPGLEALAEDADALVRLGSGQPLLVLPARVRVR